MKKILRTKVFAGQHIKDSAWCSHDDMRSLCLQLRHFVAHICTTDARMAAGTHIISKSHHNLLNLYTEYSSFNSTRETL